VAILGYAVLLCAWLAFVVPALRAPRGARGACAFASGIGLLAALREYWMSFVWGPSVVGPIRLDIPLVVMGLAVVYAAASALLWHAGWRRSALLSAGLNVVGTALVAIAWTGAMREGARLTELFHAGNRLLFEAKFRNQEAYERYFGMAVGEADAPVAHPAGEGTDAPVGHWAAEPASRFTRLVVSPQGRAFLFYPCSETECQFGPGTALREASTGPDAGWEVRLVQRGVGERRVSITRPAGEVLAVRIDGGRFRFRRAPPPLLGIEAEERLGFLGAYAAVDPVRQHARVSQLWLWRGEEELLAIGIFRLLVPGRRADFVSPQRLGRGRREGGSWRFRWEEGGRTRDALLRLSRSAVRVELSGDAERWPPQILEPRALFRDDVVELAPRTSAEDWEHWFETLLPGHFSSAEIPAR
jgi:hypothetical protein